MITKLTLLERTGTLDEFSKVVWELRAMNLCDEQEAIDAIASYARELAEADDVRGDADTQEIERTVDPDHECTPIYITNQRVGVTGTSYLEGPKCEGGCCQLFICKDCGTRFMVNGQSLIVKLMRHGERAEWERRLT